MLRRAAWSCTASACSLSFASARRKVGSFNEHGKRTDITTLMPKSKRPMNDAARQQLLSRLNEEEARAALIASRDQALVARAENGEAPADDEPQLEPTLDDLDISIPQVDCPFMAELVQRRLILRGAIISAEEAAKDAEAAAAERSSVTGPSGPFGTEGDYSKTHTRIPTKEEPAFSSTNASSSSAAAAAIKADKKGQQAVKTDGTPERTFRAPVEDDRENSGKEVVPSSDALEGDEDAAKKDGAGGEPEAEPWRDEYEDGFVVIDVRSIGEIEAWGIVEGAKALPANDFYDALSMRDADAFEEQYGFARPDKELDTLIIYCQYGPRSLMAAQIAVYLGYKHVMVLKEGYYEWAKQFNKLCRRYRLLDIEMRFEETRAEEFRLSRGIAADIAPEFNEYVEAEVDTLRLDASRTRGKIQHPVPPAAIELLEEVKKARELEADLLNDPEYRAGLIQQYDSEYPVEGAIAGGPAAILPEPRIRSGPGTDKLNEPTPMVKKQLEELDANANPISRAADALGIPKAPTVRERKAESFGTRLLLAGSRHRKRKLSQAERKVAADHAELRQAKKYPHKSIWRTH